MKAGQRIPVAIFFVVIGISTLIFILIRHHGPHLPRAKTAHPAGTFIPKDQLAFAGFKTPEAAMESAIWAYVNGEFDALLQVVPVEQQGKLKQVFGTNGARFKNRLKRQMAAFQGTEIMARKNVSANRVELKYEMVDKGTNFNVGPMVKIGNDWKFDLNADDTYKTNWDSSGDIVTFAD